jgi:uncharacterized protein
VKPTHFDLTVDDLPAARRFFEQVLGWEFERFPMPTEIYRIKAGDGNEPGINGTIGAIKDASISNGRPMTNLTVVVSDLDQMLAKVEASSGKIIEQKMPVPGIGWYATCAEPGGLTFGLMQADTNAR